LKIGLLGGTFNPVHYGHLINAEIIKENFKLDKILFIPSKHPVHKNLEGNVSSEDRFNMLKLAVDDNAGFDISRIEIDRNDESYFIITIKKLFEIYKNAELFLLIGADAFNEINIWKDSEEILQIVSFIVMKRPGYENINHNIVNTAKYVKFIENPLIGISSSKIRENIRNNKSIKYLVPLKVEEYIISKELYKI
jgi:nicotinate-nucleotide adenylyltransferase